MPMPSKKQEKKESFTYEENTSGEYRDTWKVFRIMSELVEGYQFLSEFDKEVTVFGSARTLESSPFYQSARKLGKHLAQAGYTVITGGGPGIMEAANRGAVEGKGESLGLNIQLPFEQRINPYVRKSVAFYYFFTRKVMLTAPSHAFVFYPGGYGTLDELFEVLDNMELGFTDRVPVVLVGKKFWDPLIRFLRENAFQRVHSLDAKDLSLVTVVDTPEAAFEYIRAHTPNRLQCTLAPLNFHCEKLVNWRIFQVMSEVVEGFEFLTGIVDDVTILGTKSIKKQSAYYKKAKELGRALAQQKFSVTTGGMRGIAEAANMGALKAGGDSIGIYTRALGNEEPNVFLNRSISFRFSFIRKLILTSPSKAFVLFPGGFGTLDQCFEVLTLIQTRKMSPVPVILFGSEYWRPLLKFIHDNVFERHHAIKRDDIRLFTMVDDVAEALELIVAHRKFRQQNGS